MPPFVYFLLFSVCLRQQRNALGGGGCKRRVAARCDGRITLLLDHLGPAKGCLMQNPGLRDPTAGSKNCATGHQLKVKEQEEKRVKFFMCVFSTSPSREVCRREWATGAEEIRIQT